MVRLALALLGIFVSLCVIAETPVGFLWYNLPKAPQEKLAKHPGIPFNQLSFTARDAVLRFYTMEALHKARHTKSLNDMRIFLSLQGYWLKESSRFANIFQQAMLAYPQYDYTVTHPVSNLGIKTTDSVRQEQRHAVITKLAKSHGLLFFYRGQNPYDQKQIAIVRDFCEHFNLPLIPVSVDGVASKTLAFSRRDTGQANALGIRYFPALVLVNPKTNSTMPVAYGLTTQDVLEQRLVSVATQFQGEV